MDKAWQKELVIFIISILPLIFLFHLWDQMPDRLALHYNFKGEIDRWGSKREIIPFAVFPLVTYLVLLVLSKFRTNKLTENFYLVKLIAVIVISGTILFMLYLLVGDSVDKASFNFFIVGGITIVVGYLMKSIKANYFIGIRTPWTLNNEKVWDETHYFASGVFVIAGILIISLSLFLDEKPMSVAAFLIASICIATTLLYSYSSHRRNQDRNHV